MEVIGKIGPVSVSGVPALVLAMIFFETKVFSGEFVKVGG
jgi:hypothetical protein